MKKRMRWMSALLAALLAFGGCGALAEAIPAAAQLTLGDLEALGATAYLHDGRVTFVDGPCVEGPVSGVEDAGRVVDAMLALLGGDGRTRFEPWRTVEDAGGNRYYVFQQMYAGTTVSGGAVKVVTGPEGNMLGLAASVESELPEAEAAEGIAANRAEALVLEHLAEANQAQAELVEGRTELIVLPVNPGIDLESEEEKEESRFVWAVYTTNPDGGRAQSSELPYLAHYVTMDGAYLYSLPTILPGDEAGVAGYNAAYVFEFMEPVDYTGTVKLSDGSEREITVSVMRDTRTGMYYLGNVQRRIAVADCYEFIYNDGRVVLEASPDNEGWDSTCLLALYNYCRAWDYYDEIGWTGGDGLGTPMLILKDYCNGDRVPQDNAAYAGKYYGWQTFLSSDINDFSQCLDVLAHEFTHCVTGSVMTYNAYMNDYGAINEAMSDIQGNICEMMMGATADDTWLVGENSIERAIRSMSDPQMFDQPAYAWDLYYVPKVKSPTTINDRGGVHTNSSLLNNVAYRLCADGGMTLEEARAFWFAVDCAMVPGTDYAQLSELMPWVLKTQGMEGYAPALEVAMDATRLRTDAMPDAFDEDRALVTLTLPDRESFGDGNWMLLIVSVNTEAILRRAGDILGRRGEYAGALEEVAALLGIDPALLPTAREIEEDPGHAWDRFLEAASGKLDALPDADKGAAEALGDADSSEILAGLREILRKYFGDTVYSGTVGAGQDGRTVRMVCRPGTTLPVLYRLEIDGEMRVGSAALAAYTLGRWHDVASMLAPLLSELSELDGEGEMAGAEPEDGDAEPEDGEPSWPESLFDSDDAPDGDADDAEAGDADFSWLAGLFGLVGGPEAESDSGEETPSPLGGLSDLFGGMGWLRGLLFYQVKPGEANAIPDTGLDGVGVLLGEDYPFLNDMFDLDAPQEDGAAARTANAERTGWQWRSARPDGGKRRLLS